jgi:hypothetical protein
MKLFLLLILFHLSLITYSQGSSCSTSIPISLDSTCYTFTNFPATFNSAECINSPVKSVYLRISTTSLTCSKIYIKAQPGVLVTASLFNVQGGCNNDLNVHRMCFYDGIGIWAPSVWEMDLNTNSSYALRISVPSTYAGSVEICGTLNGKKTFSCLNATPIDNQGVWDDNSCYLPGPGITPGNICAFTIENTAWYVYTVAVDGISGINITNIDCDGFPNYGGGIQIGAFIGTCIGPNSPNNGLTFLQCNSGSSTFMTFTTSSLPAGTKVYIAIDGNAGANCKYKINGFNAMPLSVRSPNTPYNPRPKDGDQKLFIDKKEIKIEYYSSSGRTLNIEIIDIQGRKILSIEKRAFRGLNTISIPFLLPRGIYFLTIIQEGKLSTYKIFKG